MDDLGVFVDRGTTRFVRELDAPPSAVWAALTDPAVLGRWFIPNPGVEHRTGGRWWFVSADDPFFRGTISRFDEGRSIEYRYDNGSVMSFRLGDAGEGRCSVVFEHVVPAGFVVRPSDGPSGDGWTEQPAGPGTPQPAVNASWHNNLDALALVLAGAPDTQVEATARREITDPDAWRELVARYRAYLESNAS
jgi:uncharacterized protein YndB with AHSA1/START domain